MFPGSVNRAVLTNSAEMDCSQVHRADQLQSLELQKIYRFWKQKAGDRLAPARADIDVPELRPWLPHVLLADLIEGDKDIRFRVIGTWIADQVGRDDTGKTLSEIDRGERSREILEEYRRAARDVLPYRACGTFFAESGAKEYIQAERLLLPFSSDGISCDKVFSAIYFLDGDT